MDCSLCHTPPKTSLARQIIFRKLKFDEPAYCGLKMSHFSVFQDRVKELSIRSRAELPVQWSRNKVRTLVLKFFATYE